MLQNIGAEQQVSVYLRYMITLEPLPINYEILNELYAASDQSLCLNKVSVPLDEDMTRAYFSAVRSGINCGMLFDAKGIYLDGRLIGKIERTVDEEGCAEIDLMIVKDCCGQGHGTEALRQFLNLTETKISCETFSAYIERDNSAAARVLEKNGFEAKRKFLADVVTPQADAYALRTVEGMEYIRSEDRICKTE